MQSLPSVPAFTASVVEFIEALTIVLAVGTTRQWRAALWAAFAATLTLGLIIAMFGAAVVTLIPRHLFQVIVGALLLLIRVPVNPMKFVVGAMFVTLGIFWSAEGFGAEWPLEAASLPVVFAAVAAVSWVALSPLQFSRLS